jgi:hypothetical protein
VLQLPQATTESFDSSALDEKRNRRFAWRAILLAVPLIYIETLREALGNLASAEYQRMVWLGASANEVDSFEEASCHAFDDSGLSVALDNGEAESALGGEAVESLRALDKTLGGVDVQQPVPALIASSEMDAVRSAAKRALDLLPA